MPFQPRHNNVCMTICYKIIEEVPVGSEVQSPSSTPDTKRCFPHHGKSLDLKGSFAAAAHGQQDLSNPCPDSPSSRVELGLQKTSQLHWQPHQSHLKPRTLRATSLIVDSSTAAGARSH